MGAYMFAVLAGLRAAQLMRGCTPRVDGGIHKPTTVAQLEIVGGMTGQRRPEDDVAAETALGEPVPSETPAVFTK